MRLAILLSVLLLSGCAPFNVEVAGSISYGENQKIEKSVTSKVAHESSKESEEEFVLMDEDGNIVKPNQPPAVPSPVLP